MNIPEPELPVEDECEDVWHIGAEYDVGKWCPSCGWCEICGVACDCELAS